MELTYHTSKLLTVTRRVSRQSRGWSQAEAGTVGLHSNSAQCSVFYKLGRWQLPNKKKIYTVYVLTWWPYLHFCSYRDKQYRCVCKYGCFHRHILLCMSVHPFVWMPIHLCDIWDICAALRPRNLYTSICVAVYTYTPKDIYIYIHKSVYIHIHILTYSHQQTSLGGSY